MKKLNKLFAILIAVLGVTTLKAQTDVTSTHLTNAGFDDESGWKTSNVGVTSGGNMQDIPGWTKKAVGWSSAATFGYGGGGKVNGSSVPSTGPDGTSNGGAFGFSGSWDADIVYTQAVTLPAGVYTLSYKVFNAQTSTDGNNKLKTNKFGFVASSGTTFYGTTTTFTKSEWTEANTSFVLTTETSGNISIGAAFPGASSSVTPRLIVDGVTLTYKSFDDVSAENPADFTSLIKNPSFETGNLDGWTYKGSSDTGVKPNSNNTYKTTGVDGNYLYNTWWQGTPLTQTVGNIPNGIYELKVLLASDQNAKLFLLANDEHSEVYTITTDNKTFHDVSYEFKVLNGQATIGVIGGNDAGEYVDGGHWWYKADNFRLIYKGADISIEKEALEANIATARAIDQATIPTAIATQLTAAITAAENVEQTLNAIKAATNDLIEIINLANELKEPYGDAKTLIAECEAMLTNSTASDKATYQSAINKAKEDLEDANAKAAIDDIMATLRDAQKAYCLVAAPTEGHPFDLTWLVVNPKFDEGTKGWTSNTSSWSNTIATNQGGAITGNYYENWNESSYTGEIYQQLENLPKGKYVLTAAAFRDQLTGGAAEGDAVYVFANDQATLVTSATPEFYSVEVSTTTGTLIFGVKSVAKVYKWMGIDNVTLKYVAGLDLSEFTAAYNAALEAAEAARDNAEYSNVSGAEKTALLAAIAATPEQTQEALSNATDALKAATATFTAAKGDYDKLVEEKEIAAGLGMSNDLINPDAANTKTGLQALQDLKVAEYTYIYSTYTESATLGSWTENFAEDLNGEGYKTSGPKYLNEWGNATRTAKQTVKLPAGDYAISSIGRGQVGTSGYLYYKIGGTTNKVDFIMKGNRGLGVDVNGVANFSGEGEYNCNGEGFGWEYRFITFHLDAETEVEIGVSATFANAWVSIYAPVLLTTEASVKALRLSEIATALGNVPTGKMDATVQAELNDAVADAEEVTSASTIDELNSVSTALTEAIAKAKASVADYAAIKTYIDKADKIGASIAASYKSQYENGSITETATNVFQALEVATYNYVTEEFSYPVELTGEWTKSGPVGELSDQHWSGEKKPYMEQSSAAWGANAWEISYDQDLTLPAGEYVFKVAGRKASGDGCTLNLIVTKGDATLGTVNDFPEGDTGRGIDTSGAANFSDEGTYANNGNGRGWQWRYVKFTLDEAATVNIAVKAKATTNHQWISFCDATVQMTEETYLEANKGGLDAPTAAAEALVGTKPMGTAANQALKDALNMPVTTGAELLAKIEALNTAVANAKAWVVEYNNAKVQLVEALERFETDYNDGANGCLYHLQKAAWSTVIEKVQAAALAKDVTNSYAGFETATTDLVAALDAAQASINMYANFAAEISYAKAYTPIVTENAAAHNAAITAAENAYNAAETDDASELIRAMQNFRVNDYEYVSNYYNLDQPVELNGEWTGDKNTANGQHWKGDNTSYYDYNKSNEKPYEAKITVTLLPGEYVLMAAGRAQTTGSSAYIKVNNDKLAYFAAKGNTGYGIDTDGKANFSSEATYANDNKGRGWEYRFIEFTLTEETEVTLVAGMQIGSNSWASVCTPVLFTTPLDAAKNDLQTAIKNAENALSAYPVGEEAFQVSDKSDLYVALKNAIATAQNVLDNATTADALTQAIEPLNTAIDEYTNGYVLNNPEDGEVFNIVLVYAGWNYDGKAMTYIANDRDNHGLYNIKYKAEPNANYAQAFTFTPIADKVNHYTLSMTDVDGNERYVCTGTVYGGNASQIRTTTEADKALAVKVIATSTDGIWNLYNTEANNYIGSQDEGVFTVNSHINFNLRAAEKANVTLTISSVGWATLILPFNADIPEGVVAYTSEEVADYGNGDAVQLIEAESFVANTPYLVSGVTGSYVFSGYGLADKDSYTEGLFVGTYAQIKAEVGSYVLQNPKDDEGNPRGLGFYLVGEGKQPTVGAYRSYMKYEASAGENKAQMFRIGGTTGIDNTTLPNSNEVVIYDLMGLKVTTMEKGNMYIINGRKVIVK